MRRNLAWQIRRAREARGITQAELANAAGVSQPLVSRLECGQLGVASQSKLLRLAEYLGIDTHTARSTPAEQRVFRGLRYCPNVLCPTVLPYTVGQAVAYRPTFLSSDRGVLRFCCYCGRPLYTRCTACGALPSIGAFCGQCGAPYVQPDDDPRLSGVTDLGAWTQQQRALNLAVTGRDDQLDWPDPHPGAQPPTHPRRRSVRGTSSPEGGTPEFGRTPGRGAGGGQLPKPPPRGHLPQ